MSSQTSNIKYRIIKHTRYHGVEYEIQRLAPDPWNPQDAPKWRTYGWYAREWIARRKLKELQFEDTSEVIFETP